MTCGIYKLSFKGTNGVYIGQSENIEGRFIKHISNMKKHKSAKKLQYAYDTYGTPSIEVLAECDEAELDEFENETIEIWDAVNTGFNSLEKAGGTPDNSGTNNGMSTFSKEQILQVFELLILNTYSNYEEIIQQTGVSNSVVSGISAGRLHTWLKEDFSDKYATLIDQQSTRKRKPKPILSEIQSSKARGIIHPLVVSPSGEVYQIDNVRMFAREHELNQGNFHSLLVGRCKSVKGWKLLKTP